MNHHIRLLAALFVLITPVLSSAQELHTFSNGEVADAEKINENFQYLLNNAGGGCSAAQDGSSVVITCADGSSGVLASAGTVVVYPEGLIGEAPLIEYNTGDIVYKDANDIVLGLSPPSGGTYQIIQLSDSPYLEGSIVNHDGNVYLLASNPATRAYFLTSDCSGSVFSNQQTRILYIDGEHFAAPANAARELILFKSRRTSATGGSGLFVNQGNCEPGDYTQNAYLFAPYTPAPEIQNAAYPVRLEQLP